MAEPVASVPPGAVAGGHDRGVPRGLGLRRLGVNVVATMARQFAASVVGLATVMVVAQILGPDGNGQYAMAILLPSLLANVMQFGIGSSIVYFVGRGSISVARARSAAIRLWLGISAAGCGLGWGVIALWGEEFGGVPTTLLVGGVAVFPTMLLHSYHLALLQAKQDFRRYNIAHLAGPVATLPLMVALVWVAGLGVAGALLAFGLGYGCALAIAWHGVRRHAGDGHEGADAIGFMRRAIDYGWKAHLGNILAFLNYRADLFLVTSFLGAAPTGIYVIAVQMSEKLWTLSQAVSTVLFPRLAELSRDEDTRRILTPLIARIVLVVTSLAAAALAAAAGPLIALLFGGEYGAARNALHLLLPGIVLLSVSRVLSNDIAARGRPEINMYAAAVTVVVNILGNILLIPGWGIAGAAVATTASYGLDTATKIYFYARLSGNSWWEPIILGRRDWELARYAIQRIAWQGRPGRVHRGSAMAAPRDPRSAVAPPTHHDR